MNMARNVYENGRGGKFVYMFRYTCAGIRETKMQMEKEDRRACLSIFIYGETNKQFSACGNIVYGETGKIQEIALSQYPRQANCNVNRTKTYNWISSKLTPVDASYSCTFCTCFATQVHSIMNLRNALSV